MRALRCAIARQRLAVVMVACGVAFAVLALYVWSSPRAAGIETVVADVIAAPDKNGAYRVFKAISVVGSGPVVAAAAVALALSAWWWSRNLRLSVVCVLGPALAGIGEVVLKDVVGRPRASARPLSGETGYGFPSGHAAGAGALAVVVVLVAYAAFPRRHALRVAAAVAAALYAFALAVARVVVGAHFVLDVVGGLLLGTTAGLAAVLMLLPAPEVRTARGPPGPSG